MRTISLAGVTETIWDRADFPPERVKALLQAERLTILGYGAQGRAQAMNLRDQGFPVIVGVRPEGESHARAVKDDWNPGATLLTIGAAAERGTVVFYLLSDAGQKEQWAMVRTHLTAGKGLVFAHGFSLVYKEKTGVVPPPGVDVLLVAPKGAGATLREQFLAGTGMNAGFAVAQNATGRARERCQALCFAIGASNLFETTFEREVICDLVGERGSLLGAIYGLWLAQYEVLRAHGHSALEAFSETVEEATQSLYPLIAEHGMDWMYAHCSTTAQRGALDWYRRFRDVLKPMFEELYRSVQSGTEAQRALDTNSRSDYPEEVKRELGEVAQSEMWEAGKIMRGLRADAS